MENVFCFLVVISVESSGKLLNAATFSSDSRAPRQPVLLVDSSQTLVEVCMLKRGKKVLSSGPDSSSGGSSSAGELGVWSVLS